MKIISSKGCGEFALMADGIEISELPLGQQKEVLDKIIESLTKEYSICGMIDSIVTEYGEFDSDLESYEHSGDIITCSTLKIE